MKNKKAKVLNLILPVITLAFIVAVWAVAAAAVNSEYILPSVYSTVERFFALFKNAEFYLAFSLTLLRSLIAFLISFLSAFVLAVLTHKVPVTEKVVSTVISVVRALPTIAIVLLILFWTNSQIAPIIVTLLVVLPTSYTHLKSAFSSLDKTVIEAGRVDGADEKRVFLHVEFPQVLPAIYSAIGSGISLNFKLMVAAEVLSQTANSIGYMLNTSKVYFEIAEMLALVCTAVIFGVAIEFIFNFLSKKSGGFKE